MRIDADKNEKKSQLTTSYVNLSSLESPDRSNLGQSGMISEENLEDESNISTAKTIEMNKCEQTVSKFGKKSNASTV